MWSSLDNNVCFECAGWGAAHVKHATSVRVVRATAVVAVLVWCDEAQVTPPIIQPIVIDVIDYFSFLFAHEHSVHRLCCSLSVDAEMCVGVLSSSVLPSHCPCVATHKFSIVFVNQNSLW